MFSSDEETLEFLKNLDKEIVRRRYDCLDSFGQENDRIARHLDRNLKDLEDKIGQHLREVSMSIFNKPKQIIKE